MQRLFELDSDSAGGDVLSSSQMQDAPSSLQLQSPVVTKMVSQVRDVIAAFSTVKMHHLLSIRNSPRYVNEVFVKQVYISFYPTLCFCYIIWLFWHNCFNWIWKSELGQWNWKWLMMKKHNRCIESTCITDMLIVWKRLWNRCWVWQTRWCS